MCKACEITLARTNKVPVFKCFEPNCEKYFLQNKCLLQHLTDLHGMEFEKIEYKFNNKDEFRAWKESLHKNYNFWYEQNGSNIKKDTFYYKCSLKDRSGKPAQASPVRKKRGKKSKNAPQVEEEEVNKEPVTVKKEKKERQYRCSSFIRAQKMENGEYNVVYQTVHYGHTIGPYTRKKAARFCGDTSHLPVVLTKKERRIIADKLNSGMTPYEILEEATQAGTKFGNKTLPGKGYGSLTKQHIDDVMANLHAFPKKRTSENGFYGAVKRSRKRKKPTEEYEEGWQDQQRKSPKKFGVGKGKKSPVKKALDINYGYQVPMGFMNVPYETAEAVNNLNHAQRMHAGYMMNNQTARYTNMEENPVWNSCAKVVKNATTSQTTGLSWLDAVLNSSIAPGTPKIACAKPIQVPSQDANVSTTFKIGNSSYKVVEKADPTTLGSAQIEEAIDNGVPREKSKLVRIFPKNGDRKLSRLVRITPKDSSICLTDPNKSYRVRLISKNEKGKAKLYKMVYNTQAFV